MAFVYDPGSSIICIVASVRNSVLPAVLASREFWGFFIMHIVFKFVYVSGFIPEAHEEGTPFYVHWDNVKIITAIAIFFLVFYTQSCYARYVALYRMTRDLLSHILDYSFMLRIMIKRKQPGYARLSFRYCLLSAVILLLEVEQEDHAVTPMQWDWMLKKGLLTAHEYELLMAIPEGERSLHALAWSMDVIAIACHLCHVGGAQTKWCDQRLEKVRTSEQNIIDYMSLSVPFQYFHVLNIMVSVNTFLWCYKMAINYSASAVIVFALCEIIFLGMLDLSAKLSIPFGPDEVDFPNAEWIGEFSSTALATLEGESPGEILRGWEQLVKNEKPLLHFRKASAGKSGAISSTLFPPLGPIAHNGAVRSLQMQGRYEQRSPKA